MKKSIFATFIIILGTFWLFLGNVSNAQAVLTIPRQDSDGDGLFDFYEKNVWGTSAAKKDTDGDGYSDSDELRYGYNPLDPTPYKRYLAVTFSPVLRSQNLQVHGGSILGQYAQVETLAVKNISELKYLRVNGVSYLGGTIVNPNTAITLGDDLRVDGEIWRGPSKGVSDGMPLKISDTVIPTLDNINDLGSVTHRWRDLYVSRNIAAQTSNVNTLYANTIEVGDLTTKTISGTSINGTTATFSDLTVSRKLDVLGKLKAGQGATKDVDILGNLKVTGEIDPTKIIIQPKSSTDNSLVVKDAEGREAVIVDGTGGLVAQKQVGSSVDRVFTVAKNTGTTIADLLYVNASTAPNVTRVGIANVDIFNAIASKELTISLTSDQAKLRIFGAGNVHLQGIDVTIEGEAGLSGLLTLSAGQSSIIVGNAGVIINPKSGQTVQISGGYGSTGVTIYDNGELDMDGILKTEGIAYFGGGYYIGGSGVTIEDTGNILTNGSLSVDSAATFGSGAIEADTVLVKNSKWFKLEERNEDNGCDNVADEGRIEYRNDDFYGCRCPSGTCGWAKLN